MGKRHKPRDASMGFWPRRRSRRIYSRVRAWPTNEKGLLGFSGYKVGMVHLIVNDTRKTTMTKGQDISMPATIMECPPIRIFSVRFYKNSIDGKHVVKEVINKLNKECSRKVIVPKKTGSLDNINLSDYDDVTVLVYTQPHLSNTSKKKPEVFEMALGGTKEEKLAFAKDHLAKEITLDSVFKEGDLLDIHGVTKGKGFQGPVKRFGISIRQHKSEKVKRGPGTLGGWTGQGHFMYRVSHAGQMGYHSRIDFNKQIMKISTKPEELTRKGGFHKYGVIRSHYMLLRGSVSGPKKRIVRFVKGIRPNPKIKEALMPIREIVIR